MAILVDVSPGVWKVAQHFDLLSDDLWTTVVSLQVEKAEIGELVNPLPYPDQLFHQGNLNYRPLSLTDTPIKLILQSLRPCLTFQINPSFKKQKNSFNSNQPDHSHDSIGWLSDFDGCETFKIASIITDLIIIILNHAVNLGLDPNQILKHYFESAFTGLLKNITENSGNTQSFNFINRGLYALILRVKNLMRGIPKPERAASFLLQQFYHEIYKFDFSTSLEVCRVKMKKLIGTINLDDASNLLVNEISNDSNNKTLTSLKSPEIEQLHQAYLKDNCLKSGVWIRLFDKENISEPLIGQILDCLFDATKNQHYLKISRYLKPDNDLIASAGGKDFFISEVFRCASAQTHPIEDFLDRCLVLPLEQYLKAKPLDKEIRVTYFCRYAYNPLLKQFTRLSEQDFSQLMPNGYQAPELKLYPKPLIEDELKTFKSQQDNHKNLPGNFTETDHTFISNQIHSDPARGDLQGPSTPKSRDQIRRLSAIDTHSTNSKSPRSDFGVTGSLPQASPRINYNLTSNLGSSLPSQIHIHQPPRLNQQHSQLGLQVSLQQSPQLALATAQPFQNQTRIPYYPQQPSARHSSPITLQQPSQAQIPSQHQRTPVHHPQPANQVQVQHQNQASIYPQQLSHYSAHLSHNQRSQRSIPTHISQHQTQVQVSQYAPQSKYSTQQHQTQNVNRQFHQSNLPGTQQSVPSHLIHQQQSHHHHHHHHHQQQLQQHQHPHSHPPHPSPSRTLSTLAPAHNESRQPIWMYPSQHSMPNNFTSDRGIDLPAPQVLVNNAESLVHRSPRLSTNTNATVIQQSFPSPSSSHHPLPPTPNSALNDPHWKKVTLTSIEAHVMSQLSEPERTDLWFRLMLEPKPFDNQIIALYGLYQEYQEFFGFHKLSNPLTLSSFSERVTKVFSQAKLYRATETVQNVNVPIIKGLRPRLVSHSASKGLLTPKPGEKPLENLQERKGSTESNALRLSDPTLRRASHPVEQFNQTKSMDQGPGTTISSVELIEVNRKLQDQNQQILIQHDEMKLSYKKLEGIVENLKNDLENYQKDLISTEDEMQRLKLAMIHKHNTSPSSTHQQKPTLPHSLSSSPL
ncbi:hypothetical protein O181_025677 [Austropuccinia psidii MF-1]|uniref:BAH domain-containing protein n=1 Tax=Austropuccinia psidii MF-1 TaxID=1389203 RepID=A0A9Q3CLN7_9BASI|nr:hypothetical protein [Austropuccinia psidii MF-1]